MLIHVPRPQSLHLGRRSQQIVELPLAASTLSVLEHDDMVCPTERLPPMRDRQHRPVLTAPPAAPTTSSPSPRRGRSTDRRIPAVPAPVRTCAPPPPSSAVHRTASPHAARPPCPARLPDRRCPLPARRNARPRADPHLSSRSNPKQNIPPQFFAEQTRHLRCVSHSRRHQGSHSRHRRVSRSIATHRPAVGSEPSSTLSSVLFPAPTLPVMTVNDPFRSDRSTSLTPRSESGYK